MQKNYWFSGKMRLPERITKSPPYLFAELDKILEARKAEGAHIINIAQGDPDIPTPEPVIQVLVEEAWKPVNHRYPSYVGHRELRSAITDWMKKRFGVDLDPEEEIMVLIGAKEGITHSLLALVEKGDRVLVGDPCYPTYFPCVYFAEGEPVSVPLTPENGFLPPVDFLREMVERWHPVGILLNYPNNPTGAVAPLSFFQDLVKLARERGLWVIQDNAYSEIYFGSPTPSILQVEGAKDCAVELFSFSKMLNMTGWRLGWICGNREMIRALYVIKTNTDSGVFNPIQLAGIRALKVCEKVLPELQQEYKKRKDYVVHQYRKMGLKPFEPGGTFYIWTPLPDGETRSLDFVLRILRSCNVLLSPGSGYGTYGEGYFRTSLTQPMEKIEEAVERLRRAL